MKTRLEDIAERAGVSAATVSRVVNGKPGVSERTRETVLAALEHLGYERPAKAARSRTRLVGLIVPELDNPIFPLFVQMIERALAGHGYTPLLCTATPIIQEDEYIDMLLERGVDGLVIVAGRHANTEVDHRRYVDLRAAGVAIVFINGFVEGVDAPFISTDDAKAMQIAVEHLHSLGHRRIGCVMGPRRYSTSQRKVAGFVEAMAALPAAERQPSLDDLVVHAIFSIEGGQAATETLMERGVTAVVCGSDLMALGAIRAARGCGMAVPRDLSVVGYDDSPLLAFTDPPLTTVRQHVAGMCRDAVGALLDEIRGAPQPRRELLFHPELVVRSSTGPARASPGRTAILG